MNAVRRRGPGRHHRCAGDRGAGTVLALGLISVLAAATIATATLGRVIVARHRASAAADLAALAAAAALADEGPLTTSRSVACRRGARVAVENGARLARCDTAGAGEVAVVVEVTTGVALPMLAVATARARAGPSWPGPTRAGLSSGPRPASAVPPVRAHPLGQQCAPAACPSTG